MYEGIRVTRWNEERTPVICKCGNDQWYDAKLALPIIVDNDPQSKMCKTEPTNEAIILSCTSCGRSEIYRRQNWSWNPYDIVFSRRDKNGNYSNRIEFPWHEDDDNQA